jgi:hypothetical protein
MDRMGMEDPEQGVLPPGPLQVRVGQNAEEEEGDKQQNGQPQLPEEDDQDAARCRSNRRALRGDTITNLQGRIRSITEKRDFR